MPRELFIREREIERRKEMTNYICEITGEYCEALKDGADCIGCQIFDIWAIGEEW